MAQAAYQALTGKSPWLPVASGSMEKEIGHRRANCQNSEMDRRIRATCFAFLALMVFLSVVLMVLGIWRRFSRPDLGTDPQYFECFGPAVFFGLLLLVFELRLPTSVVVGGLMLSGVASLAWAAHEFHLIARLLA